jgi:hypothetical protein
MAGRDVSDKDLLTLYRDRLKDREQSVTRRRKALESTPKPMDQLLDLFFGKSIDATRKIAEWRAKQAWPKYVGPMVARYTRVERINGDKMVVLVGDALVMPELLFAKNKLLKMYARDFPALGLRDIFFLRKAWLPPADG